MEFPKSFIADTRELGGYDKHIAAPYFRRSFFIEGGIKSAEILISGLGFYRAFINGVDITKGHLAPYISNSDHTVYFDSYDITKLLTDGENVLGIVVGNGMQNCFDGYIWDFDTAIFRTAPKTSAAIEITLDGGRGIKRIETDKEFLTAPSPIVFNSLRSGEFYDARREIPGWNLPGFDASGWRNPIIAEPPRGEYRICDAEPILPFKELKSVSITKQGDGYLYDFGENCAGVTRLKITGNEGQKVSVMHGDYLINGELSMSNIGSFTPDGYHQMLEYTCKGNNEEIYSPIFTYYGFQYALVTGITEDQATPDALTYIVMNSALKERGNFECSDDTANRLYKMCLRSTLANFFYFPTDCPHREKNGWTGDASVSCEHTLLNFQSEKSYSEWLNNIRPAMKPDGMLPGIVPTDSWGYFWGNGPCWDQVLTTLPYYTYLYRGDRKIIEDNSDSIFRYLNYLSTHLNEKGLVNFGLGDWVQVDREAGSPLAPVELTNSIMAMEISRKAAHIFGELGLELQKSFALSLRDRLRSSIRKYKIDFGTMTAAGRCQTSQAMAIFYGVFDEGEKQAAFNVLLKLIEEKGNHFDVGMLGLRVLFHLLSDFGYSDLAWLLIMREDYPSYAYLTKLGLTAMVEEFRSDYTEFGTSFNHHFLGDINGWFIKDLLGIKVNPYLRCCNEVKLSPAFISSLSFARGYHVLNSGKLEVEWKRDGERILFTVSVPDGASGEIILPTGWVFEEGGYSYMKLETITDKVCIRG